MHISAWFEKCRVQEISPRARRDLKWNMHAHGTHEETSQSRLKMDDLALFPSSEFLINQFLKTGGLSNGIVLTLIFRNKKFNFLKTY
jgi:hypothetical protein